MATKKSTKMKSRRGFAVVIVLYVIGILMVLASALTFTAVLNSQNTISADTRERAYNTAESGIADVITGLGNGTITSLNAGQWVTGNSFPQAQDSAASYDYYVEFNNGGGGITAADPLTSTGGACGSLTNPGFGCVAIPPAGVLVAVKGHYNGRVVSVEAEAVQNDLAMGGNTLLTKGDAGTNGNGNIAADPCLAQGGCFGGASTHNVKVFTDGNFNGGKGLVDGSVQSAGTATATLPTGCAWCMATSNAAPIPFPASNNIVQQENQWKNAAIGKGHYYGPNATLPSSINISGQSDIWFIDQSIDLKNIAITNNGGRIVVTGAVTESGNQSAANYSLSDACNLDCTCHSTAQLIGLSTNGVAMHGQGTGKGNVVSQGVIFAPSGPMVNTGNGTLQGAIVASTAQIGGAAALTADTCAAQATINLPGYNITGYGER